MASISFGNLSLRKIFFGTSEISKAILNGVTFYESTPQLDAPTNVSVSGTNASFDEVDNAESYEFFVDGTSIGEYSVQSWYDLTLNFIGRNYRGAGYNSLQFKINGMPSNSNDYEYQMNTPWAGSWGNFESMSGITPEVNVQWSPGDNATYTLHNVSSVTMWIEYDDFDDSDYICINGSTDWDAAPAYPGRTMNLSANTTINIYYDYDT